MGVGPGLPARLSSSKCRGTASSVVCAHAAYDALCDRLSKGHWQPARSARYVHGPLARVVCDRFPFRRKWLAHQLSWNNQTPSSEGRSWGEGCSVTAHNASVFTIAHIVTPHDPSVTAHDASVRVKDPSVFT